MTHDVHYENFRSERLARGGGGGGGSAPKAPEVTKDAMLAEKDEELRRMQEMLAMMQVCWASSDIRPPKCWQMHKIL